MTASYNELAQHLEEIRRLYEVERMPTRNIAALYNTSKTQIVRFFRKYGIPVRSNFETRFGISRDERAPTKEQLEQHLDDGLAYREIAKMYECDHTAVSYWIKRYGIEWKTGHSWTQRNKQRGFIEPTPQELYMLYCVDHLGTVEIGRKFNVTNKVIVDRLEQYGIEIRPAGWAGKYFHCLDGHEVKSVYEQRVDDWLFNHGIEHIYEPSLPFNAHCSADFLVRNTHIEIWGVDAPFYNKRKQYKLEQYALHNLPLVQINHWDFTAQKKGRWNKLLTKAFL